MKTGKTNFFLVKLDLKMFEGICLKLVVIVYEIQCQQPIVFVCAGRLFPVVALRQTSNCPWFGRMWFFSKHSIIYSVWDIIEANFVGQSWRCVYERFGFSV